MRAVRLQLRFVLFEPAGNIQNFGDVVAGAATMPVFDAMGKSLVAEGANNAIGAMSR